MTTPTPRHHLALTNDERTALIDALFLRQQRAADLANPANPDHQAWAQIAATCAGILDRLGETS